MLCLASGSSRRRLVSQRLRGWGVGTADSRRGIRDPATGINSRNQQSLHTTRGETRLERTRRNARAATAHAASTACRVRVCSDTSVRVVHTHAQGIRQHKSNVKCGRAVVQVSECTCSAARPPHATDEGRVSAGRGNRRRADGSPSRAARVDVHTRAARAPHASHLMRAHH